MKERYTAQAHHNAQTHSDEFVKSALVSLDKLPLLIQELLTYEVSLKCFAEQARCSWAEADGTSIYHPVISNPLSCVLVLLPTVVLRGHTNLGTAGMEVRGATTASETHCRAS